MRNVYTTVGGKNDEDNRRSKFAFYKNEEVQRYWDSYSIPQSA